MPRLFWNRRLRLVPSKKGSFASKKGSGAFCAKHPLGRSGKTFPTPFSAAFAFALATVAFLSAGTLRAQEFTIFSVYPPGGRPNTFIPLRVRVATPSPGAESLHFSDPRIKAAPVNAGGQKSGTYTIGKKKVPIVVRDFTVDIPSGVSPGVCEVRAVAGDRLSAPRAFVVGDRLESVEHEPNDLPRQATQISPGTVVNGRIYGRMKSRIVVNKGKKQTAGERAIDADCYKFQADKGQRILIDCWANRIDSRLDATLVLYDAEGHELESNRRYNRRDPLIDFTAPADGEYVVKTYDSLYRGGSDYVYRLELRTGPYVEFIFPPVGKVGATGTFTLYGRNLPGGSPAHITAKDGLPLEKLKVQIELPKSGSQTQRLLGALFDRRESLLEGISYRLRSPAGDSNPVFIGAARAPIILENEPNNAAENAQALTPPCEYVGKFFPRGDRDWITFRAKKGETYAIDVLSHRLGVETDPYFVLQQVTKNKEGEPLIRELKVVDDANERPPAKALSMAHNDPSYRFVAPADGIYRLLLRQRYYGSWSDPRLVYRLIIRPADSQPEFSLIAVNRSSPGQAGVRIDRAVRRELIDVTAYRRNDFKGAIQLSVKGLPKGVRCEGGTIGPGQSTCTLVVATDDAAEAWSGPITIVGRARMGDKTAVRHARQLTKARMANNFMFMVGQKRAIPFEVTADTGKALETSRGGKLSVPVKVTRLPVEDHAGNIGISAIGLPPGVQVKNTTLKGTSTGQISLLVSNKAPVGTYWFYLRGGTGLKGYRPPEAVQALDEEKKQQTEAAEQIKAAAAVAKKAAANKVIADRAAAAAIKELNAALQKARQADRAAAISPHDKKLLDAKKAALKSLDEAKAKAEAARVAREAAAEAVADATARARAAVADKKSADSRVKSASAAAKPRNVGLSSATDPILLKITPAPIALSVTAPSERLKQGGQVEFPVKIDRLYDFADAVQIQLSPPKGAGGLSVSTLKLQKEKTQGKITVKASAKAAPGKHALTVRATLRFNKQPIQVVQTIPLTVELVKQKPKPKKTK